MKWIIALRDRYRVQNDPLLTERRVELGALLLTGLLLLQLMYSIVRLSFLAEPEPIAPSVDILNDLDAMRVATVDVAMREEIRNRPLFWPGRRPLPDGVANSGEPDAGKGAKQSELDEIKLVGVFGGGDSAGIIALVKGNKRRILLGENLDGWTLKSVEASECVLTRGARRETLTLQRSAVAASAPSRRGADQPGEQTIAVEAGRVETRVETRAETKAETRAKKKPTLSAGARRL
jgi:hypothetical protein